MDGIYLRLGRSIRAKRLQLGLTLEELAELAGLHPAFIGQIERNTKKSSLRTVAACAKALGVRVDALLSDGAVKLDGMKLDGEASAPIEDVMKSHTFKERTLILSVLKHLSAELKRARK